MPETQEYWFAARTRKDQEFSLRDSLGKLGIECFLPTRVVVRQLKYRRKRVEVPVIRNLLFVHTTKEKAWLAVNESRLSLFFMKDLYTGSILVIPDKQMRNFMFVMDLNPDGVSFDNDGLHEGIQVRVVKGEFSGVEGELVKITNRTHVVIRIPQIFSLCIRIPKSYLRIVE
ncbi:Transcription antitermination protein RfaH [termite gut metagenome]|jgi:transcription antitermination factor NusG|uniref:Transcription antitermination protein RfaH n=1 Tax=termite gut metagenome TaxID=433724 RepID=A0A5J4RII3_9ZZZZ